MSNYQHQKLILFIPFIVFLLLFILGISLPLHLTPHYGNYMSRIWNWTEVLIALTAIYYIIRNKTFNLKQMIISLFLGAVCLVALFRDPRYIDIIITSICVAVTFYGACRIFDQLDAENPSINIRIVDSIKYFALGAVISIPLALLNVLFFSLQGQINMENILYSAIFALKPAVSEEVVFRFFLLAFSYYLLHGKVTERFLSIYIYILIVIPHSLLHYPDLLLASPVNAILLLTLNSVIFGFPMALLMKQKNLQMAIGMHWFIDFIRFAAGF